MAALAPEPRVELVTKEGGFSAVRVSFGPQRAREEREERERVRRERAEAEYYRRKDMSLEEKLHDKLQRTGPDHLKGTWVRVYELKVDEGDMGCAWSETPDVIYEHERHTALVVCYADNFKELLGNFRYEVKVRRGVLMKV